MLRQNIKGFDITSKLEEQKLEYIKDGRTVIVGLCLKFYEYMKFF